MEPSTIYVLGTAQDGGVPHVGCERDCCREARESGEVRFPACLGIHQPAGDKLLLIEATPAMESQLDLLHDLTGVDNRGRSPVDGVLLTHAHIGHYLGLAQFGREVAGTKQLPVYVTHKMAAFLRENAPWSQLVTLQQIALVEIVPGKPFSPWTGLTITAISVPHRDEFSDTVAFRIEGGGKVVLFVPDIDSWDKHPGLLEELLKNVDVAYLDATFYDGSELPGRDLSKIPHPLMIHSMERLAEAAAQAPGTLRFIHLNHSNPAWRDSELRLDLETRGFRLAKRGEQVILDRSR